MPQTYLFFFFRHFLLNFFGKTNLASMILNGFVVMQKQWNYMLEFLTLIVQLIIYYILHNKIMSKRNCTRDQAYILALFLLPIGYKIISSNTGNWQRICKRLRKWVRENLMKGRMSSVIRRLLHPLSGARLEKMKNWGYTMRWRSKDFLWTHPFLTPSWNSFVLILSWVILVLIPEKKRRKIMWTGRG